MFVNIFSSFLFCFTVDNNQLKKKIISLCSLKQYEITLSPVYILYLVTLMQNFISLKYSCPHSSALSSMSDPNCCKNMCCKVSISWARGMSSLPLLPKLYLCFHRGNVSLQLALSSSGVCFTSEKLLGRF